MLESLNVGMLRKYNNSKIDLVLIYVYQRPYIKKEVIRINYNVGKHHCMSNDKYVHNLQCLNIFPNSADKETTSLFVYNKKQRGLNFKAHQPSTCIHQYWQVSVL